MDNGPLNKYIGSSFDDFLAEEGLLAEVHALAQKCVIAFQLEQEVRHRGWTRAELAACLGVTRLAVDHLLDPQDLTVDLQLLGRVADLLGKRLSVTLH